MTARKATAREASHRGLPPPLSAPHAVGWPWRLNEALDCSLPVDPPQITLVTPSYQQAEFLERTIRSVLLQGYPRLKYWVLDGGSSDGSVEILRHYDAYLDGWRSAPDEGQSAAIAEGFERAADGLFNWINSDDYLLPGALHTLARAYGQGRRAVYAGSGLRVDETDRSLYRSPIRKLQGGSPFTTPWIGGVQASWFWDTELWREIGGLDPSLRYTMDVDLHLRLRAAMARGDAEMVAVEEDLAAFRYHAAAKTTFEVRPAVRERLRLYRSRLGSDEFPDDRRHRRYLRKDIAGLGLQWARRAPTSRETLRMILDAFLLDPGRLARRDSWRSAWRAWQDRSSRSLGSGSARCLHDGRLVWYRRAENDWFDRFDGTVASSHEAAQRGRLGRVGEILEGALPRSGRVLEAGAGTGWIVAGLRRKGFDVEGVELSSRLVSAALEIDPALPLREGDVTRLDVPDDTYDAYISLGVVEHRKKGPEPFLAEAERVVKPGGLVCLSVPYFNPIRRLRALFGAYRDDPSGLVFYQYGFRRREIEDLLARRKWQIVDLAGYGTARCFEEEFPRAYRRSLKVPLVWRWPRISPQLDRLRFGSHMIMVLARLPNGD